MRAGNFAPDFDSFLMPAPDCPSTAAAAGSSLAIAVKSRSPRDLGRAIDANKSSDGARDQMYFSET
jgi:hypothetical protein